MKKKDQIIFCQSVIASGKISPADLPTLISILSQHSEWEDKMGVGLKSISIGKGQYGTSCFYVNRIDGSTADISFRHAVSPRTPLAQIKMACRHAIRCVIEQKRNTVNFGTDKCPFTGEFLLPDNTHIDHYNLTFSELFNLWLAGQDQSLLFSAINPTTDNNTQTYFTDNKINHNFLCFHNRNTNLRAVSSYANLNLL